MKTPGDSKEGDMVDTRKGNSRVLDHREEVGRELDSEDLCSRDLGSRDLGSLELGSLELDSRSRGVGMKADLLCGVISRTDAPEGTAVGSSILTRVFSREDKVKPTSRKTTKLGWESLFPNLNQKN